MTTQVHQVAILKPLAAGAVATLCTIFIHAIALGATVNFFRRETRLGRAGMRFFLDFIIVVSVMSFAFVAHVIEVAVVRALARCEKGFPHDARRIVDPRLFLLRVTTRGVALLDDIATCFTKTPIHFLQFVLALYLDA